tara:strand:- start:203 stop:787 length:585 start_codon:yes stop_codon:yes gene_type:complete
MSSILKVDTIQDADGNNIINESGNTITIGASGDTISIPSGATITNSGTATGFGKIGQVISASTTTQSASSSSTFADVTNLSVAITPSASSSKILITVFCNGVGKETNNAYMGLRLLRGSTDIALIDHLVGLNGGTASNYIGTSGIMYLDSPSTTSATTYKMQFNSEANNATVYINRPNGANVATSTITVMEVLA